MSDYRIFKAIDNYTPMKGDKVIINEEGSIESHKAGKPVTEVFVGMIGEYYARVDIGW